MTLKELQEKLNGHYPVSKVNQIDIYRIQLYGKSSIELTYVNGKFKCLQVKGKKKAELCALLGIDNSNGIMYADNL